MSLIPRRTPNLDTPTEDDLQGLFAVARPEVRPLDESRQDRIYMSALAASRRKTGQVTWRAAGFAAVPVGIAAACLVLACLQTDRSAVHTPRPVAEISAAANLPQSRSLIPPRASGQPAVATRTNSRNVPSRRVATTVAAAHSARRVGRNPRKHSLPSVEFVMGTGTAIALDLDEGAPDPAAQEMMAQAGEMNLEPSLAPELRLVVRAAEAHDPGSAEASATVFAPDGIIETNTCTVSSTAPGSSTTSSVSSMDGEPRIALTIFQAQATEDTHPEDEQR